MGKFYSLNSFPQGLWGRGHVISKDIVIQPFNYAEQNNYLKIFIRRFWEKSGVRGGLVTFRFFLVTYEGN